jgi:hypothetical protein
MTGSVGSVMDAMSVNTITMSVRPHKTVVRAMRACNDSNCGYTHAKYTTIYKTTMM